MKLQLNKKLLNKENIVNLVQTKLTKTPCLDTKFDINQKIFPNSNKHLESIIRDNTFWKTNYFLRNSKIRKAFESKKTVWIPIPKAWLDEVESFGIKINKKKSLLIFYFLVCASLIRGILFYLTILSSKSKKINIPNNKRIHFIYDLKNHCLPPEKNKKTFDFVSWFILRYLKKNKGYVIAHNNKNIKLTEHLKVNVKYLNPFAISEKLSKRLTFCKSGLNIIFIASLEIFQGKWWTALLLPDLLKGLIVRINNFKNCKIYINNGITFKPIWMYEAEAKNCEIYFYFTSTNNSPIKTHNKNCLESAGWKTMRFKKFLIWHKNQSRFISKVNQCRFRTKVVGPIWMYDSIKAQSIKSFNKKSIAIFDIAPKKIEIRNSFIANNNYISEGNCIKFLSDILKTAALFNLIVYLKPKRSFQWNSHDNSKTYCEFLKAATETKKLHIVDVKTSPQRIISKVNAIFSFPFTSTGIIAKSMGKPSFYYDPTGLISNSDRSAFNVPILSNRYALKSAMAKLNR